MRKVLLSVLLVGFLAGCEAFANRSQFAPVLPRQADTVGAEATAAEPEDDGGFFDGLGDLGDIDGGDPGGGFFDGDDSGGGLL